jgi:hypothetical protein
MVLNKWLVFYYFVLAVLLWTNTTKKKPLTGHYFPRKTIHTSSFRMPLKMWQILQLKSRILLYIETIDYLNSKTFELKALDDRYVTVSVLNKTISVCGIVSDEKNLV